MIDNCFHYAKLNHLEVLSLSRKLLMCDLLAFTLKFDKLFVKTGDKYFRWKLDLLLILSHYFRFNFLHWIMISQMNAQILDVWFFTRNIENCTKALDESIIDAKLFCRSIFFCFLLKQKSEIIFRN